MTGRIFDIKRFAIHDGDGLRTTVFFKGCPLGCAWCHNPEGMRAGREVLVRHERCVHCHACVRACAQGAIAERDGRIAVDHDRCRLALGCVEACPTRALERAWRDVTVDELVDELMRDEVFFEGGGGVTLSGGEPMMQGEFVLGLLRALKARGVHVCVESSMMADERVVREANRWVDHWFVDIKLMDDAAHRRWTGASNAQILENFAVLARGARALTVRVPLIPGITATEDNLRAIARHVRHANPALEIELLNYNPLAPGKYEMLGRSYFDDGLRALPKEELAALKRLVAEEA